MSIVDDYLRSTTLAPAPTAPAKEPTCRWCKSYLGNGVFCAENYAVRLGSDSPHCHGLFKRANDGFTAADDEPIPYVLGVDIGKPGGDMSAAFYSDGTVRTFESGATRDTDEGKLDFEGFYDPAVLVRFAEYMHENRIQSDGTLRDSDNWQKGMPKSAYLKSGLRHKMDVWLLMRGKKARTDDLEEALCACIFNDMGLLSELLKERGAE